MRRTKSFLLSGGNFTKERPSSGLIANSPPPPPEVALEMARSVLEFLDDRIFARLFVGGRPKLSAVTVVYRHFMHMRIYISTAVGAFPSFFFCGGRKSPVEFGVHRVPMAFVYADNSVLANYFSTKFCDLHFNRSLLARVV